MKTPVLLILFFLFYSFISVSQENQIPLTNVETNDGNEYLGRIVSQDSVKIVLSTSGYGEINIMKENISKQTEVLPGQLKNGKLWFENPQATRYLWSPNGFGLMAGEGYYQNIWVLYNQFAVGITDYISIGGGLVPLFLFEGAPTPVWITPKFSIPINEHVNLGAGGLFGTVLGEEETGFGIVYGLLTIGNRNNNVSVGSGYGYAGGYWAENPLININAMFRTGAKGYFITENYIIPGDYGGVILSFGGRRMIKKVGLDFGLAIPIIEDMGAFIALPFLGFTIPFGKIQE